MKMKIWCLEGKYYMKKIRIEEHISVLNTKRFNFYLEYLQ